MSHIEWSAFSYYKDVFMCFQSLFWLKPLKCGSAASCFAEQKMLLWAWHAVSVECRTDTAHCTPSSGICLHRGRQGLGSTAWTAKPRRDWGCLHGSPHCTWGSQASLAALCTSDGEPCRMVVWQCSSFKRCKFRALPQQAACRGWDSLLPLNHSSASSWQAGMSWLWRADRRKDSPWNKKIYWKSRCCHFSQLSWDFF